MICLIDMTKLIYVARSILLHRVAPVQVCDATKARCCIIAGTIN